MQVGCTDGVLFPNLVGAAIVDERRSRLQTGDRINRNGFVIGVRGFLRERINLTTLRCGIFFVVCGYFVTGLGDAFLAVVCVRQCSCPRDAEVRSGPFINAHRIAMTVVGVYDEVQIRVAAFG